MEELAAELTAGLARLKRGYVDAAEALLRIINPAQQYPYDFVVYRLTGYRPVLSPFAGALMSGKSLCADLRQLMLDVCDSFELSAGEYDQPVEDAISLARRFNVSTKTVQRWRHYGLPARRLVFPDGKRRLAFLESSVQWFTDNRRRQIAMSVKFAQMSPAERSDILRRARRMSSVASCRLSEVARRLAIRTGRAV